MRIQLTAQQELWYTLSMFLFLGHNRKLTLCWGPGFCGRQEEPIIIISKLLLRMRRM